MTEAAHQSVSEADVRQHICEVIPFPVSRRVAFIERNRAMGDKYVRHLLAQQRRRLELLGVEPRRIDAEMTDMERLLLGITNSAAA